MNISDVRMAGYSLSSLENHLDSLGASYVDGVKVRVNPRYPETGSFLVNSTNHCFLIQVSSKCRLVGSRTNFEATRA